MARLRQEYVLIRRTLQSGKRVYYVRFAGESGTRSTGCTNRSEAEKWARREMSRHATIRLSDVLGDAYDWDRCQHVTRLRAEGKQITRQHAANQRSLLDTYISTDPVCAKPIGDLTRGDIIALRDKIRLRTTASQSNRAIGALRVILEELVYRQVLDRNPCSGVDRLAQSRGTIGIFSKDELVALFEKKPGHWGTIEAYAAFLLAATTGMRRGEILALTWEQVDFDHGAIKVTRAFKGDDIGKPKWGKERATYLPVKAREALLDVRNRSLHVLPDALVFCDRHGRRRGGTWWQKHFDDAIKAAKFDKEARNLRPHSLRHSVATLLRTSGADPEAIRASMGWAGAAVQAGYTHWGVEHFEDQRRQVDQLFGGEKPQQLGVKPIRGRFRNLNRIPALGQHRVSGDN